MEWQIFGHDWAVDLLQHQAANSSIRHAYLFMGPKGVGRRTMALRFAQSLNCSAQPTPGVACLACRDCRQIEEMVHPDLSLLTPEEGHKDILIDQVRSLQHTLSLAPYASAYRIALLPDFQRATTQAANALLKTLEEPSDRVVLLLTASVLEALLPTIVSRCEVIRLRPSSIPAAQAYFMENMGLTEEKADLIAHLSGGRIGAGKRFIEETDTLDRRREVLENLFTMLPAAIYDRFKTAENLTKSYDQARKNVGETLPIWLSFWRDVFVRASGSEMPLVNIDIEPQIKSAASTLDIHTARSLVVDHEQAIQQMDAYVNVRLLVENLMLKWPNLK